MGSRNPGQFLRQAMNDMTEKIIRYRKKSWQEKLEEPMPGFPKIVDIPPQWARHRSPGPMVILTPALLLHYIRSIPKGYVTTMQAIRSWFAARDGSN